INPVQIPANHSPVANADGASTTGMQPVTIYPLSNDSDPDAGDTIHVLNYAMPTSGLAVLNADGSFTYTAQEGFVGTDWFQYTITDSHGATASAIISVQVMAPGTYDDGLVNASAGSAQYPQALNAYFLRAPWHVAGVDYAVGVPAGTVLKDPR